MPWRESALCAASDLFWMPLASAGRDFQECWESSQLQLTRGGWNTIAVSHILLWQLLQCDPRLDSQDCHIGDGFYVTAAQFRKTPKYRGCF